MSWWLGLLAGCLAGLIIVMPIIVAIRKFIRNTKERVLVKKLLKLGQILMPIDAKDYNIEMWKEEIPLDEEAIKKFNKKLFKKPEPEKNEEE